MKLTHTSDCGRVTLTADDHNFEYGSVTVDGITKRSGPYEWVEAFFDGILLGAIL